MREVTNERLAGKPRISVVYIIEGGCYHNRPPTTPEPTPKWVWIWMIIAVIGTIIAAVRLLR